ncbi:MAG: winged helix-turn-helix transcriptional regulator [bacterium]|nr:winged helix-turn-helix transcriptional regulator [bacterium]
MEELSEEILERIASRLKAMGNPFRLRILQALHEGELSVTEILARVGGSQANVSKHLNVLRGSDLVTSRREGVSVYYRISDATVFSICQSVCDSLLHQASAEMAAIAGSRGTS